MKLRTSLFFLTLSVALSAAAQPDRWQQRVKYTMDIDMNVQTNQYAGKQKLEYWNNSPDTLKRVFYHLYFNAFQPGSMMDTRSRRQGTVVLASRNGRDMVDWDDRVRDRIQKLTPEEQGYQKIASIRMDGRVQKTRLHETILEVQLDRPILPKSKVTFDMEWTAQVPLQIRRCGRDNPGTTVRYTMTQWYPKLAEYDYEGWHADPYVAREFYGVWGDYDVTIRIDKSYLLGGSGTVVNGNEVGFGYGANGNAAGAPVKGDKRTWRFVAPNVHDFAWAADPGYKHITRKVPNGPLVHVLYKTPGGAKDEKDWNDLANAAVMVYPYIAKHFGEYPYKDYSFIHGGDGGMEYPNATMLADAGTGAAFHEWIHNWYQGMLASNEAEHAWMDEGFTQWAAERVEAYFATELRKTHVTDPVARRKADSTTAARVHAGIYGGYYSLVRSGREEPLGTHADQFNTNMAYSNAAYTKGGVFVEQLGYIVGADVRDRIMLEYYRQWRFKHPNPTDFVRVAEKVSGLQLNWYRIYWANTTKTIDYAVDSLWTEGAGARIRLRNDGMLPMPLDVKVTFKDGSSEWHYIPQYLMFGEKPAERGQEGRKVYESWRWTHPTYEIATGRALTEITSVEIDPSGRMADINKKNNKLEIKW
ncbi:M1 family metallopeptidase [Flaviaesturariibacter amylovorans]|uniref:M1 family metallopeptidase n=1 Tax=Flaviaesturariibacter amylovorans TaxID=1084520 RepID=A0ABP8HC34_9BACT